MVKGQKTAMCVCESFQADVQCLPLLRSPSSNPKSVLLIGAKFYLSVKVLLLWAFLYTMNKDMGDIAMIWCVVFVSCQLSKHLRTCSIVRHVQSCEMKFQIPGPHYATHAKPNRKFQIRPCPKLSIIVHETISKGRHWKFLFLSDYESAWGSEFMHVSKSNIKYDLPQLSQFFKILWILKFDRGTFTERVEKMFKKCVQQVVLYLKKDSRTGRWGSSN